MKVLLIAIFVSVIGYAQIQSDYDKSIDFASYKTYSFEGWEKIATRD
ncbi:hypothetical protein [Galbibacter pacificus]|uniref:Uncharacterized protein n=1 Tax=Galbibacter pacificus TaxID=2996052 RepID=A0ABT6FT52_9FLAO|nr:hypothetical protein [Galbibacter pacificus]MDG3582434.1 hypothetical protein [Galbibacter pacificus]MDG3586448.1 hypothetical protein [Galbibacter pacificus]